jgi:uncharacterized membrane protein YfcA
MLSRNITLPELALIAGTRAMAGAGIGLLVAPHLKQEQRRTIGWTLLAVGLLTTIPLAADVLLGHPSSCPKTLRHGDDAAAHELDNASA